MKRTLIATLLLAFVASPRSPEARRHVLSPINEVLRHRQNQVQQPATAAALAEGSRVSAVLADAGNIAVLDESDGIVVAAKPFDLDLRTLEFQSGGTDASQYTYALREQRFDVEASTSGARLVLGDDEAARVALPFSFPFFGRRHAAVFVHSDGNLSFVEPDTTSATARDLERLVSGPARIAPLFSDLDPSQTGAAISFVATTSRFLVTWNNVPFFSFTPGPQVPRQTFQAALFPDGRIEFSYRGVIVTPQATGGVIVGIAPGSATVEQVTMTDFSGASSGGQRALVEEFSTQPRFDILALTKKFYRNHENPYDFLVVFDTVDRGFDLCAAAVPVRNAVYGIGLGVTNAFIQEFDFSSDFGSGGRLQTLVYMGPLGRYPASPAENMPRRSVCGPNSVLSILGQEAGHRFLAYVLFLDSATGRLSNEMLGRDFEHWSFYFNSDASVMEGQQIEDKGSGVSPRFETKEILQRYSALDQYLMGLRAPEDVPTTFLVRQPSIASSEFSRSSFPQSGLFFDGTRVDITMAMIQAAEGRRAPDHTVSPKNFRFAFALLIPAGATPSPADIAKLDRIRTEWEPYFRRATSDRGQAETAIVKQLTLSNWPASGILSGRTATASVSLGAAAAAPVTVSLAASDGSISVPGSVTIPTGQRTAEFSITGNNPGVAVLTARGADDSYEIARTSIQVRASAAGLRLEELWNEGLNSGLVWTRQDLLSFLSLAFNLGLPPPDAPFSGQAGQPLNHELIFRLRDNNFLPYPGVRIEALASGAGAVPGSGLVTDARGWVRINWKLDQNPGPNTLIVRLADQQDVAATVQAVGLPTPGRHRDPRTPSPTVP